MSSNTLNSSGTIKFMAAAGNASRRERKKKEQTEVEVPAFYKKHMEKISGRRRKTVFKANVKEVEE